MKNSNKIIVPAAAIAAASQALMALQPTADQISLSQNASQYDAIALSAVSTARGQDIIRHAQPAIVKALRIDQELLNEGYAEAAGGFIEVAATGDFLADSATGGYFSCYNNCHSACHGSRGWR